MIFNSLFLFATCLHMCEASILSPTSVAQVYVGGYLADEHLVGTSMPGLGGTTVYSHIRLGQAAGAVGMEPFIGVFWR